MKTKENQEDLQEQVSDVPTNRETQGVSPDLSQPMVDTNIIYYADCLTVLQDMPDESVDMIYLDPPFDQKTNKVYGILPKTLEEEDVLGGVFEKGDVGYINLWLAGRLRECKRVLKPTGSIFLHLSKSLVFDAKIMMDKIFGKRNFKNALAWCVTIPSVAKHAFPNKYDIILFYGKTTKTTFNVQRIPYGNWGPENIGSAAEKGQKKRHVVIRDVEVGKAVEDWWIDIQPASRISKKERTGYPTEKPPKLLERIIKSATNEGDIVMDPFAGSGTTGIVADRLGRKWIMIDASDEAQRTMQKRFEGIPHKTKSMGTKPSETSSLMAVISEDPTIAEKEVCKRLGFQHTGKVNDHGLDGIKEEVGLQVKRWGSEVGAATIREFAGALLLADLKKGIFVASGYSSGARETAVIYESKGIKIELELFKSLGLSFTNIGVEQ